MRRECAARAAISISERLIFAVICGQSSCLSVSYRIVSRRIGSHPLQLQRTAEWYGRIDGNDYDNGQHGDDVRPSRVIVVFRVVLGLMCTREPLQMRVRLQVLVLVLVRVSMLEILRA